MGAFCNWKNANDDRFFICPFVDAFVSYNYESRICTLIGYHIARFHETIFGTLYRDVIVWCLFSRPWVSVITNILSSIVIDVFILYPENIQCMKSLFFGNWLSEILYIQQVSNCLFWSCVKSCNKCVTDMYTSSVTSCCKHMFHVIYCLIGYINSLLFDKPYKASHFLYNRKKV